MGTYRYWQHFLALEADFASTARYVEFSLSNFRTFSIEYAKLLLAIGSEVDVLCKVMCERIDSSVNRENIDDYRTCIGAHSQIVTEKVLIRRYNLDFEPGILGRVARILLGGKVIITSSISRISTSTKPI